MLNLVKNEKNLIQFGIIGETNRSAPALLATAQGADAHQERMTAMASIAVPLHSRKYSGLYALVDECDYELVSQYRWNVQPGRNTFYAISIQKIGGKTVTTRMHRLVASASDNKFIDHVDGDGLNNTRSNLQEVNNRENLQRQCRREGTSRFTGVYFDKHSSRRPWKSYIGIDNGGGPEYLGRFSTEEEAARAYDNALDANGLVSRFRNFPRKVEVVEKVSKTGFDNSFPEKTP